MFLMLFDWTQLQFSGYSQHFFTSNFQLLFDLKHQNFNLEDWKSDRHINLTGNRGKCSTICCQMVDNIPKPQSKWTLNKSYVQSRSFKPKLYCTWNGYPSLKPSLAVTESSRRQKISTTLLLFSGWEVQTLYGWILVIEIDVWQATLSDWSQSRVSSWLKYLSEF